MLERDKGIERSKEYPGKKSKGRDPRTYFPPFPDLLQKSRRMVEETFDNIRTTTRLQQVSLSTSRDGGPDILNYARELAIGTGIFPPDSLHLAIAISELVDCLVVTDSDFLDRIHWHKHRPLIDRLLADSAFPNNPPSFCAVPLVPLGKKLRVMYRPKSVFAWLDSQGIR